MTNKCFKLGIIQLKVGENKSENVQRAVSLIREAAEKGSKIVALPECFNSPYGTKFFPKYAELIPDGETSQSLSAAAKNNKVYLVGGSIPEECGGKLYNSCTIWNPAGELIAKHRKIHLFDIDVPGIKFKESETLSPGDSLTTFTADGVKIGIGICYDVRFEELARIYRQENCDMVLYPGAFNMTTGPMHWELLLRGRAVDCQLFTAGIAPAQDKTAGYLSYGHSMVVNPWGKVLGEANLDEEVICVDIDLDEVSKMRSQIPTGVQRRNDLYETVKRQ